MSASSSTNVRRAVLGGCYDAGVEVHANPGDAPYIPNAPSRMVVASDGTLAAIVESSRIVVVELPSCAFRAEHPIDSRAEATDVAWVSAPTRLLVLSRYSGHTEVGVFDPLNPQRPLITETRLESPMRLLATVGVYALTVGPLGAVILSSASPHLRPFQFPARNVPIAAGGAGSQFVVALSGSIEEWDPQSRMPKRRLKLPRPAVITAVGGSDRVVWMTTKQEPNRIDAFAMVNRGQPKHHEIPEPIAHVAAHPRSDLLVCIGQQSGRMYAVDLDGKSAMHAIDLPPHSRDGSAAHPGTAGVIDLPPGSASVGVADRVDAAGLLVGRSVSVVAVRANQPMVVIGLATRQPSEASSAPEPLLIPRQSATGRAAGSSLYGDDSGELTSAEDLAVWKLPHPGGEVRSVEVSPPEPFGLRVVGAESSRNSSRARTWRDELVAWLRGLAGGPSNRLGPAVAEISAMLTRFHLSSEFYPAISMLYAAHLCGQDGAGASDLAWALGGDWDEALGKGKLHGSGMVQWRGSRICLAPSIARALDGREPASGVVVGTPGPVSILGPCIVVAESSDLTAIARACLATADGAILASHERVEWREAMAEARAYGAVAMVRADPELPAMQSGEPVIIVVSDQEAADALSLPVLQ